MKKLIVLSCVIAASISILSGCRANKPSIESIQMTATTAEIVTTQEEASGETQGEWNIPSDVYVFDSVILEAEEGVLLVKVLETTANFQQDDEVSVYYDKGNYEPGQKLRVTFNGMVNETLPPKIGATILEIIE